MKGAEVRVFTFAGSRFNRLLTSLLMDRIGGKARVHYNDFIVRVHSGKDGAGQRVFNAIREIQMMDRDEIGAILPWIPVESWKFAHALPPALFADMVLSDHYHVEEFIERMKSPVILCSEPPLRLSSDET